MEAVLAPAVDAFSARLPGIELTLRTAPFGDGLQLLANGDSDLHCGGMDTDEPLPAFLRREYFLDITVGVVACEDHPLLAGTPTAADLADCPWIDYDAPLPAATVTLADQDRPSSLDRLLDGLFRETGRRVSTVLRARAAGLCLMATGSWLAWLPLNFLERLTGPQLRPLPTRFGRQRFRPASSPGVPRRILSPSACSSGPCGRSRWNDPLDRHASPIHQNKNRAAGFVHCRIDTGLLHRS